MSQATLENSIMDDEQLQKTVESLLFITDRPLSLDALCKVTAVKELARVGEAVARLRQELDAKGSAMQVLEVAEGFQMATRTGFAPFVRKLFTERMTMRLSTAALETLSIIAYKQPLTRAEIEQIRGVEVIAALETLLEKRLVKVVGRKETVGRPLMYGTTPDFLRHFGLRSLEDLPALDQFVVEPGPAAETPAADAAVAQAPTQPATDVQAWENSESAAEAAKNIAEPVETVEAAPKNIWGEEPAAAPSQPALAETRNVEPEAGPESASE